MHLRTDAHAGRDLAAAWLQAWDTAAQGSLHDLVIVRGPADVQPLERQIQAQETRPPVSGRSPPVRRSLW